MAGGRKEVLAFCPQDCVDPYFTSLNEVIYLYPKQLAARKKKKKKKELEAPRLRFYSVSLHCLVTICPTVDCSSFHSVSSPAFSF